MGGRNDIAAFWNARAKEDAFYFVDNRLTYRDGDSERFWANGRVDLDQILDSLGLSIQPSDVVVDIGCGVGRLTRPMSERAAKVYAIDISREMLSQAMGLEPALDNVEWMQGDGRSLTGIADGSANACISHVVFQHSPDPKITLGYVLEMGRVLKPGGWAAFQVSNDPSIHRAREGRDLASRARRLLGREPRGRSHPAWLGSAVDLDDLRRAASRASVEIEQVIGEGTQFCLIRARRRQASNDK